MGYGTVCSKLYEKVVETIASIGRDRLHVLRDC